MQETAHKSFDIPDETREFPNGRAAILNIGGGEVGLYTVEPGWSWSEHVKPLAGTELCEAPHFQYHLSGTLRIRMADGREFDVGPGEVSILAPNHDAWVVGDEPVTVVDWGGAHVWAKSDEPTPAT
jgi:quercetin dioxygenase-like cupin family protein